MKLKRSPQRVLASAGLLGGLALLAGCPSEPSNNVDEAITPSAVETESTGDTVIDEVEVMGVDEAYDQAEQEITDENVLDALEDLEKEIGPDGN